MLRLMVRSVLAMAYRLLFVARATSDNAAQDRRLMRLAHTWRPYDPDVTAAWHLVLYGLEHQATPTGNLDRMIGALDGSTNLRGWDEFGIDDVSYEDPSRVEIWFIRESVVCDRAALLAELSALRAASRTPDDQAA